MLQLNDLIKKELKVIPGLFSELDNDIKEYIKYIRIDDHEKGGVIWKSRSSEINVSGSLFATTTHEVTSEVSLSRALYNSRWHFESKGIGLISYEAPLLRKTEGAGSRTVSCDLIALADSEPRLCAIEVKRKGGAIH